MGLTLEAEQLLITVGLTEFFDDHRNRWLTLARETHEFLCKSFPAGSTIRRDDVAKILLPVLEVEESLTDFLNAKPLKQKYWRRHFCDLILDRCWGELNAAKERLN